MTARQLDRNTFFSIVFLISVALALTGCGGNAASPAHYAAAVVTMPPNSPAAMAFATPAPSMVPPPAAAQSGASSAGNKSNPPSDANSEPVSYTEQQHIVLKNATLTLTVESPAQTIAQVTQLAEGIGGWVVGSNTTGSVQNGVQITQGMISVRVPADKFAVVLQQIKSSAVSVDAEVITGDDVTQKYVDLNSQLTNLQSTQAQLQKIMSSATNVNDVLTVQAKLTDVEGQIEQIKGQLNYYSQAAAFSLIALTLNQKLPPATPTQTATITNTPFPTYTPTTVPLGIGEWHPGDTAREAVSTLVGLVQNLITLTIWLVIIGLPFAIVALIGYVVWRRLQPPQKRKTMG